MLGLLIVVAVYMVLGFLLAWIANMVTQDDMPVGRAVGMLVGLAIINIVISVMLPEDFSVSPVLLTLVVNFAVLAMLLWTFGGVRVKHAGIIAGIYAVVLLGFGELWSKAFTIPA